LTLTHIPDLTTINYLVHVDGRSLYI